MKLTHRNLNIIQLQNFCFHAQKILAVYSNENVHTFVRVTFSKELIVTCIARYRVRGNHYPVASKFEVVPVKQNTERPVGKVNIFGPFGPAIFVS